MVSIRTSRRKAIAVPAVPDALLAAALGSMASAVFITNTDGIILWVNDAFTRLSGYSRRDAIGRTPALLNSGCQDHAYYSLLWETILAGQVWQGEVIDRHKSGKLYVVDEIITPLFDSDGKLSHFVALQHDVHQRKQESERYRHLAYHDALTGLPNRASFLSILRMAMTKASNGMHRLALLFIDLDKFKPVNDNFGHHCGDELLAAVGARLRASIRKSDVVARLGGDEFVVLLEEKVSNEFACKLAKKLSSVLARQFMLGSQAVSIGASVGVAFFPDDAASAEELMRHADAAMYAAKLRGGDTYACYGCGMNGAPAT